LLNFTVCCLFCSAYGNLSVRSLLDTIEHCMKEFDFPDPYLLVSNFNSVNHADNVIETYVFKLMSYTYMVIFFYLVHVDLCLDIYII